MEVRSSDDAHSTTEQECSGRKNISTTDPDVEPDKELTVPESSSGANSGMISIC